MPQMSPIYWLYISLFCYFNFMMIMILMNTFYFNIFIYKNKYFINNWKWSW
uniref:ATP synthase F0 subunit 8 n=1 Tax=Eucera floralia TaxID=599063 RepID=A0A343DRI2_9HYME|nr:ATP synthase F0 subunit 8 [Eucera floralia]